MTGSRQGLVFHYGPMNPYQVPPGVRTPPSHNGKGIRTPEARHTTTWLLVKIAKCMKSTCLEVHVSLLVLRCFKINNPTTSIPLLRLQWYTIFYVGYFISNVHCSLCSFLFWFQPPKIIYLLVKLSIFIFVMAYTSVIRIINYYINIFIMNKHHYPWKSVLSLVI